MIHPLGMIAIVLCLALPGLAAEQQDAGDDAVSLRVTVDPTECAVGDAVRLTIEVDAVAAALVEMPRYERSIGSWSVRASATPLDVPEDGRRRWRHVYTLDTFAPGEQTVPPIEVTYQLDGESHSVATAPITVLARSVLSDDAGPEDFRDAKDAADYQVAWPWPFWMLLGAGTLYVIGLAAGGYTIARHLRGRPAVVPVRPPEVRALEALDELYRAGLLAQGQFEPFYTRLSGIVRGYIEERFELRALEQTTEEFLRADRTSYALRASQRDLLTAFLRASDLVKFAAHRPTLDDGQAALDAARRFVNETAAAAGEASS